MCDAVFRLRSPPVLRGWQRSQQKVNGVPLIDHGAVHLDFDVEVVTLTGKFRASVVVARQLLGDQRLRTWSDEELAFLCPSLERPAKDVKEYGTAKRAASEACEGRVKEYDKVRPGRRRLART